MCKRFQRIIGLVGLVGGVGTTLIVQKRLMLQSQRSLEIFQEQNLLILSSF